MLEQFEALESRILRLVRQRDTLRATNARLQGELNAVREELAAQQEGASLAAKELADLRVAAGTAGRMPGDTNPDELRNRLDELITEIDNCLNLLSD